MSDDATGKCPKCHTDPCVCAEIARTFKADAILLNRRLAAGRSSLEQTLDELDRQVGRQKPWDI